MNVSRKVLAAVVACVVVWVWCAGSKAEVADVFKGEHWRGEGMEGARVVASTKFGRCEMHRVRVGDRVVDDWLWFDETDAVNVLVQNREGDFLVFKQKKYGLRGPALAVLGGMIEPHETPLEAAKRELQEELSLTSPTWTHLGTYRTAANRGGGFVSCYLAQDAAHTDVHLTDDDLEARSVVKLTPTELASKILTHEFGEVKWAATAAIALLHIEAQKAASH